MAYGFRPSRHKTGGAIRASEYPITATYATAIYTGDPVKLASGYINLAAAGETMVGVFGGVEYKAANGEQKFSRYWPGTDASATNVKAFVYDDPDIVFSVEDDGVGDFLTQADVGAYGDHTAGTGDTVTGISGAALDTNTVGTPAAGFIVLGKVDKVGNSFGAANGDTVEVEVLINEHLLK